MKPEETPMPFREFGLCMFLVSGLVFEGSRTGEKRATATMIIERMGIELGESQLLAEFVLSLYKPWANYVCSQVVDRAFREFESRAGRALVEEFNWLGRRIEGSLTSGLGTKGERVMLQRSPGPNLAALRLLGAALKRLSDYTSDFKIKGDRKEQELELLLARVPEEIPQLDSLMALFREFFARRQDLDRRVSAAEKELGLRRQAIALLERELSEIVQLANRRLAEEFSARETTLQKKGHELDELENAIQAEQLRLRSLEEQLIATIQRRERRAQWVVRDRERFQSAEIEVALCLAEVAIKPFLEVTKAVAKPKAMSGPERRAHLMALREGARARRRHRH